MLPAAALYAFPAGWRGQTVLDTSQLYQERLARYVAAIRNRVPGRVPLRPFAAEITACAGYTCQQVTHDYRKTFDAVIRCCSDFDWRLPVFVLAGARCIRAPRPAGLPEWVTAPKVPPGVCIPWECRRAGMPEIPGDPGIVRDIWNDIEGLAYLYIWHLLLSF